MQLMGDVLTVLGSRLGIGWDPKAGMACLIRHGVVPGALLEIKAGIVIGGRTLVFPLTPEGDRFEFMDQGSTATTMTLGGVDPVSGVHAKLILRIPFRPRDAQLSTTPVIFFELNVERFASNFRWTGQHDGPSNGKIFLEFAGEALTIEKYGEDRNVAYNTSFMRPTGVGVDTALPQELFIIEELNCRDRLVAIQGQWNGNRLEQEFSLHRGEHGPSLALAWCAYDEPVLEVHGVRCPFHYTNQYGSIEDVAAWARTNADAVAKNSKRVDELMSAHNLGVTLDHLMSQTLHAWLANTWWVKRPDGQDWFSVWEGSCYFHSTVDVEYTQGPFYLSVWPELLEMELHQWPDFGKDGTECLGETGRGTLFLSHDMGQFAVANQQCYPHDMEVEENVNYILLAYAHWRRTGRDAVILKHAGFMRKLLDFIVACDTTGNGIPNKGCANTIDDASPAIQFGSEQVYLGVKAMAACQVGRIMLEYAGEKSLEPYAAFAARALDTLEQHGWKDDHYVVTLTRSIDGIVNPWSGQVMHGELRGWDAYHIYTANGLALLDMVNYETGLSVERLQKDLTVATGKTLGKYGCRHTSYVDTDHIDLSVPGLAGSAPQVGWVSMNMLRDIAAAYRGIDLLTMVERYWDWQLTTNTQRLASFFETFYGNNLHFYPRGVAIFGYLEAAAGFAFDAVVGAKRFSPLRGSMEIPLLTFANWEKGTAPKVVTTLEGNKLDYTIIEKA